MSLPLNWPGSLDSFATVAPTQETDDPGFELDLVVNRIHTLLMAMEAKLGTGSSTPVSGQVLRSAATGAATYGLLGDANIAAVGAANIDPGKLLASGTPQRVLATGASAPAAWQQVAAAMIANGAVGTAQLAANAVTTVPTPVAVPGSSTSSTVANNMTGASISITTQGGPVLILLALSAMFNSTAASPCTIQIWEAAAIATIISGDLNTTLSQFRMGFYLFTPTAATHTYTIAWFTGSGTANHSGGQLAAIELKR